MLHIHLPNWFSGAFLGIMAIGAVAIAIEIKAPTVEPLAQRIQTVMDGVVRIVTMKTGPVEFPVTGVVIGTGFFIAENLIMTNYHVVDGGESLTITMHDNKKPYGVEVLSYDKLSDVALLKIKDIEYEGFRKANTPIILNLESSDNIVVGADVYSVGHPWGFEWSVSQGIISGIGRRFSDDLISRPTYYIQTDAKIYSGNSGGPLIDEFGKVVGMNTQIFISDGGSFGFAIPSELLEKISSDLQEKKEVIWPVLGISIGVNSEGKVTIQELSPDKPAQAAGLQKDDTILSLNGTRIRSPNDLLNTLVILDKGETIILEIKRNDVIKMISVVLGGKSSGEF